MDTMKYKTQLEKLLAEVTSELTELGIHNPDVAEDWIATPAEDGGDPDPNVAADRVEDWNERRAVLSQLEMRYNNITRALKKIEDGTFGTCEIGGEEIGAERLDANPAARTCTAHMNEESNLPL